MAHVVCDYCGYRGKGGSISNQATDVMSHEFNCPANPLNTGKNGILIIDEFPVGINSHRHIPR